MTGAQTTNLTIRIDKEIKAEAEELFAELGMSLSTAANVFFRQCVREGGFPFDITACKPNKETIEAMIEGEHLAHDPDVKGYYNVDEAFAELDK